MANAGDGAQESGWAGARGQKQVPERYAQLQAALDQARSASADGRGGHAAAQDCPPAFLD
ncbi:unnamed protein product [Symbiodinium natans]|uniref:Uncharacterized protein n=1 Tax=Symbiodinium natans TaxID=878477 RepID=A0A812I480_9DINO|nr:unnamed protein product [Symbiodinium natans]